MAESAGLLLFRHAETGAVEVLLVHPGGPFFARKDEGSWTIPKGLPEAGEDLLSAARRELVEETGFTPPPGEPIPLGETRQKGGKVVHAWALEGDADVSELASNPFELEWPPRSGRRREFPEVDRAEWFGIEQARGKMNPAQTVFLDRLIEALARR